MPKYRKIEDGEEWFWDGSGWITERNVCRHCMEQQERRGQPYRFAEQRDSFGVYAGRYCNECWPKSGFRDACDPEATFDPMDAGESMDPDYGGAFDGVNVISDADPGL